MAFQCVGPLASELTVTLADLGVVGWGSDHGYDLPLHLPRQIGETLSFFSVRLLVLGCHGGYSLVFDCMTHDKTDKTPVDGDDDGNEDEAGPP